MKTLKFLGALLVLISCSTLNAQNQELLHKYHLLKGDALLVQDGSEINNIAGSPFFNNDFQSGRIHFKDHQPLPFKLRYDLVREEIQVLLGDGSYKVLKDDVPVEIMMSHFEKFSYTGENQEALIGYFKVLEGLHKTNPLMLLEKPYKVIKTNQRSAARGIPPKYVDKTDYYFKLKTATKPVLVQRKVEDLLLFFPEEHRQEMASYINSENLKPKREDDLRAIVNHYNSIATSTEAAEQ